MYNVYVYVYVFVYVYVYVFVYVYVYVFVYVYVYVYTCGSSQALYWELGDSWKTLEPDWQGTFPKTSNTVPSRLGHR